jgi:hypothetical protein
MRVAIATLVLFGLSAGGAHAASPSPEVSPSASPSAPVKPASFRVPATLLDLKVKPEDTSGVLSGEKGNLASQEIGFYSVRRADNFLLATIEVIRFKPDSGYQAADFKAGLVGLIGLTRAQTLRVGHTLVHVSGSKGLTNGVWFDGPYMYVLAIRGEFEHPKDLLRAALEIKL